VYIPVTVQNIDNPFFYSQLSTYQNIKTKRIEASNGDYDDDCGEYCEGDCGVYGELG
jgi:hypothetical protein